MSAEEIDYMANDDDLPAEFFDRPRAPNQVTRARDRIRSVADEMGITIDAEQVGIFAILLLGLEG